MDKIKRGAAAALTALLALPAVSAVAHATPTYAVAPAASYAELLEPIPNASERLRLADAESANEQPKLILAQYYHHHHHHWRRWRRRHYHHHHHHHHHHHSHY
jgi:hypothetical protein